MNKEALELLPPELLDRIAYLREIEKINGRIGCLSVPIVIASSFLLYVKFDLPWQAVITNGLFGGAFLGLTLDYLLLLGSIQHPAVKRLLPKKIVYLAALTVTFATVELLLHFGLGLGWLLSAILAIVVGFLAATKLGTRIEAPSDAITLWAARLMRFHSPEAEVRSKAQQEITEAVKEPDPILIKVFPALLQSVDPRNPLGQALLSLMKQNISYVIRCLKVNNNSVRDTAIQILAHWENGIVLTDATIVPILMQGLHDDSVGFAAAKALGKIRPVPENVISHLLECMEGKHSASARIPAAVALGEMEGDAMVAIPDLMRHWREETHPGKKQAFATAIALIQGTSPEPVEGTTDETVESQETIPISTMNFSVVFIVVEELQALAAEQLEHRLRDKIKEQPRYPLTSDAQIKSLRVPELPNETVGEVSTFIGTLQRRYNRGGRWQTEFYPTPIGVTFLVVYLE